MTRWITLLIIAACDNAAEVRIHSDSLPQFTADMRRLDDARAGIRRSDFATWLEEEPDAGRVRSTILQITSQDKWLLPSLERLLAGRDEVGGTVLPLLWKQFPQDAPAVSDRVLRSSKKLWMAEFLSSQGHSTNDVEDIMEKAKCSSVVQKGKLRWGISMLPSYERGGLPRITYLCRGGAALKSGLKPGDIVISIEGERPTVEKAAMILSSLDEARLKVERGDEEMVVSLTRDVSAP